MRVLLSIVAVLALAGHSQDWESWRGPTRNSVSPERGWNPAALKSGMKLKWQVEVGKGYSNVTIKGDRLYTMGNRDDHETIFCLDVKTGNEVWAYKYPRKAGTRFPGSRSTPIINANHIYSIGSAGEVICLDTGGKLVWMKHLVDDYGTTNLKWGFSASVVFRGDTMLTNAGTPCLAINKKTGARLWGGTGKGAFSTPLLFTHQGKEIAAIYDAKALNAVDMNGNLLWSYPWPTKYGNNAADPVLIGDMLYVSSDYGMGGVMLDISSGKPEKVWQNKNLGAHVTTPVHVDGYLYGIHGRTSVRAPLVCVDVKTGELKWKHPSGGSLMAANKHLIVLSENGNLSILKASPEKREVVSEVDTGLGKTCWTMPVLCRGMLYCRNDKGKLICIDLN